MSDRCTDLSIFGLSSTGLAEVDRKIVQIVAGDQTLLSPDLHSLHVMGKDIYFGQTGYEMGEEPYVQTVKVDPSGNVDELLLTQEGERGLPAGFKDQASQLEENLFLRKPPESFPEVTGWQLVMTWGYFHLESYRAQRAEALYKEASRHGLSAIRDELRKDPIVVISPIVLSNGLATPHSAREMFGMFGRYNKGDVVPAAVDLEKYPYMEGRSFEDKQFMQAIVNDFFAE